MDVNGGGWTAAGVELFRPTAVWNEKVSHSLNQGIFRLWPGRIRSLLRPLAALIFATVVFFFKAMPYSVSPLETVYLDEADFLAVDFEGVYFLAELLEVVFLGVEEELEVVFFEELNA